MIWDLKYPINVESALSNKKYDQLLEKIHILSDKCDKLNGSSLENQIIESDNYSKCIIDQEIILLNKLSLDPDTETFIKVKTSLLTDKPLLFEPVVCESLFKKGIMFARSMSKVDDKGQITIAILNTSNSCVNLSKDTRIGTVSEYDIEEIETNKVSINQNSKMNDSNEKLLKSKIDNLSFGKSLTLDQ